VADGVAVLLDSVAADPLVVAVVLEAGSVFAQLASGNSAAATIIKTTFFSIICLLWVDVELKARNTR
jgi:hypothetical protein